MEKRIVFICFLIFCYFAFYLRLTSYPLLMWDESRFAVSAFEMVQSNNFIVITYDGVPDLWNTKPPLTIWVMALFMKCFGFSDLIVRLPSAIAATITTISVYFFVLKHTKNINAAFFSGMVLISSIGFIGMHVARTGDADAMAVLFITLSAIWFYNSIDGTADSIIDRRKLYFSALFFSLALMTKSSYALFILPGLIIFVFISGRKDIFRNKHIYFSFIVSLIPLLTYYFLRENQNSGYLKAVWENELGGRLFHTIEKHVHPGNYYFLQLLNYRFFYWFYIFLAASLVLLFVKWKRERNLIIMSVLLAFSILTIISYSKTKLDWYDAAMFPFLSIVCGVTLWKAADFLTTRFALKKNSIIRLFYFFFFLIIFFYPYRKALSYINIKPGEAAGLKLKYGPFMKQLYKEFPTDTLYFYEDDYNAHLLFYTKTYSVQGKSSRIISDLNQLKAEEKVVTCEPQLKNRIQSQHQTILVQEDNYCSCYEILK